MANSPFQVRHGLVVNNTVLVANTTTGNVGIGTSNPQYTLDVAGDARITGNLTLGDSSTDTVTVNAANFSLANNVSFDSGTLFIDAQNNRVGVGITNPQHSLSVNGSIHLTTGDGDRIWSGSNNLRLGSYPQLQVSDTLLILGGQQSISFGGTGAYATIASNVPWDFVKGTTPQGIRIYGTFTNVSNYERLNISAGSTAAYIQTENAGTGVARPLYLGANNATAVTIDTAGRVGIGTTSPAYTLDVNGTIESYGSLSTLYSPTGSISPFATPTALRGLRLQNTDNTTNTAVGIDFVAGSSSTATSYIVGIREGSFLGALAFGTRTNVSGDYAEAMRITSAGRVGINTTSPAYRLDVNGAIGFNGDIVKTSGDDFRIIVGGRNVIVGTGSGVSTIRATNSSGLNILNTDTGTTRLFISDNVGIGTTSPTAKLHVAGGTSTSNTTSLLNLTQTWNNSGNTFTAIQTNITDTASASASKLIDLQIAGNTKFKVEKSGDIYIAHSRKIESFPDSYNNYTSIDFGAQGSASMAFYQNGTPATAFRWNDAVPGVRLISTNSLNWTSVGNASASADLAIWRDGSNILAQRFGASAQTFRLYGTYTDSANYERLSFSANSTAAYIQTQNGGTGIARPLYLGANNQTVITVATDKSVGVKQSLVGRSDIDHVTYSIFQATTDNVYLCNDQNRSGGVGYPPTSIFLGSVASDNFNRDIFRISNNVLWIGGKLNLVRPAGDPNNVGWASSGMMIISRSINTNNLGIGTSADDSYAWLQYWHDGITKSIAINPNGGNVGIGTTSPTYKLHVSGNVYSTDTVSASWFQGTGLSHTIIGRLSLDGSVSPSVLSLTSSNYTRITHSSNNYVMYVTLDNSGLYGISSDGGTSGFNVSQTNRVGIGTSSPTAKLDVAAGTSTSNTASLLNLTQTWNNSGNTFTAIKTNITNTASASDSKLIDLQVGGNTKFSVLSSLGGRTVLNGPNIYFYGYDDPSFAGFNSRISHVSNETIAFVPYNTFIMAMSAVDFNPNAQINKDKSFGWSDTTGISTTGDLRLWRDAAGILAQRNSTSGQTYRVYGTYTDSANYERLSFSANSTAAYIQTENAGTGIARSLRLGANNATVVTIAPSGNVGIGTTSPNTALDVNGDLTVANIYFRNTGTEQHYIYGNGTSRSIKLPGTGGNSDWVFNNMGGYGIAIYESEEARTAISLRPNTIIMYGGTNYGGGIIDASTANITFGAVDAARGDEVGRNAVFKAGKGGFVGAGYAGGSVYIEAGEGGQAGVSNGNIILASLRGKVGIGTTTPTALLDANTDIIRIRTSKTPASATATGNQGDICWDSNYIYVCTAANTWVRANLSSW